MTYSSIKQERGAGAGPGVQGGQVRKMAEAWVGGIRDGLHVYPRNHFLGFACIKGRPAFSSWAFFIHGENYIIYLFYLFSRNYRIDNDDDDTA